MLAYVTLLTSFAFNIFIICYIGELFADEVRLNATIVNKKNDAPLNA